MRPGELYQVQDDGSLKPVNRTLRSDIAERVDNYRKLAGDRWLTLEEVKWLTVDNSAALGFFKN